MDQNSNTNNLTSSKSEINNQDKSSQEPNHNNALSSHANSNCTAGTSTVSTKKSDKSKLSNFTNSDNQTNAAGPSSSTTQNSYKKNIIEQDKHSKKLLNSNCDYVSGTSRLFSGSSSLLREHKDIYSTKLKLNETNEVHNDEDSDDSYNELLSSRIENDLRLLNIKANSQSLNSKSSKPSSESDLNTFDSNDVQLSCTLTSKANSIRNSMSTRNICQQHRAGTSNVDANNLNFSFINRLTQSASFNPSVSKCCHNHSCHHHSENQQMNLNSMVPITSFRQQQLGSLTNQKNMFDLGMSSIQASTIISNHCNTDNTSNPSNLTAITKLTSSSSGLPVSTLTVMESPNLSPSRNAGYNWQAFMPTLKNRMATIFNCELLADIYFIVGKGNAQTRFPAHKFVLSIGSAVFDAMFNGLLSKANHSEENNNCNENGVSHAINTGMEIELPDVEPEAFKALLRFLYLDEVQIDPETVMTTLYAAKKYEVPALEIACVDFLKANLNPENAFMLLTQARLFDEATLADLCLETIDKHTMDALYSESFFDIDLDTLKLVLSRDTLRVREVSLFLAVLRWAEVECTKRMPEINSDNKRKALGDALYLLRFPLMSIEEFALNAAQSGLLTDKEVVNLFLYFTISSKPSVPFSIEPRCCITGQECIVNRFQRTESRWGYSGTSDRIRFLTDRPIFVIGFGLYGSIQGPSDYDVIIEIIHTGSGKILASNNTSFLSDGSDSTSRVMFKYPVEITQNTNYTACATLKGLDSYYGTNGCRTVTVNLGKTVSKDNVTFQFSYAAGCNNGTSVEDGQIPEIIFYT